MGFEMWKYIKLFLQKYLLILVLSPSPTYRIISLVHDRFSLQALEKNW